MTYKTNSIWMIRICLLEKTFRQQSDTVFLFLNLSNKQNIQPLNLISLLEENNKVIRFKFMGYYYVTKVKKIKIRFHRYSVGQKISVIEF